MKACKVGMGCIVCLMGRLKLQVFHLNGIDHCLLYLLSGARGTSALHAGHRGYRAKDEHTRRVVTDMGALYSRAEQRTAFATDMTDRLIDWLVEDSTKNGVVLKDIPQALVGCCGGLSHCMAF